MMVNLGKLDLAFDADAVMRGQGADPAMLRARRPALAQIAEQALEEGSPLVEPSVICRAFEVEGVRHERLLLEGGVELRGKLIAEHLGMAKRVYVLLCTIGPMLEHVCGRDVGGEHHAEPGAGRGGVGGSGGAGERGLPEAGGDGGGGGVADLDPAEPGDDGLVGGRGAAADFWFTYWGGHNPMGGCHPPLRRILEK